MSVPTRAERRALRQAMRAYYKADVHYKPFRPYLHAVKFSFIAFIASFAAMLGSIALLLVRARGRG